jgi:hypothetical protein
MALFLTLLGRFKNHIFYERKRMKKLALFLPDVKIVICIARLRNPTLTNREKNCRQGRFAAETRQSRGVNGFRSQGVLSRPKYFGRQCDINDIQL